jgi:hypothetical protein
MNQIVIYSPVLSSRFQYIAKEIFERLLSFDVQFTMSREDYLNSTRAKINYSYTTLAEREIYIIPQGLLFEQGISTTQSLLLPLSPPQGDTYSAYCPPIEKNENRIILSEDILATSFFLLSRYEEYLPFKADIHDRFTAKQSVAYRQGFLHRPLINEWAIELGNLLEQHFENISFKKKTFRHLKTYDIDMAFKYKNKGVLRNVGGILKGSALKERLAVLAQSQKDPFDIFDTFDHWHTNDAHDVMFFFLLGDWGEYDKNTHHENTDFQDIIKKINQKYTTGIHPSYASNQKTKQLENEISRLRNITKQEVIHSRQHFLKLRLPSTYQNLLAAGIRHDYTMGYADAIGFRASICSPFYWYDLQKEQTSELLIHPFQVMDVTLKEYLKWSPDLALEEALKLKSLVESVGGEFCTLWHNTSFDKTWEGWEKVYLGLI